METARETADRCACERSESAGSADASRRSAFSLDHRTQLDLAPWEGKFYPQTGELVVWQRRPEGREGSSLRPDPEAGGESGECREEEPRSDRSLRRARTKIRRYCQGNWLDTLWTFTYAKQGGEWDRDLVQLEVAAFFRRMRERYGPLPYVWALELHPGGHGWHVHVALRGFWPHDVLTSMWGHGIVEFSRRKHNGPDETGGCLRARLAAYIAKSLAGYVSKELEAGRDRHAYDVGQGFQPKVERWLGSSDEDLRDAFDQRFGGEIWQAEWRSEDAEDWHGPLVRWWVWGLP